jgi:hypothetical protein
MVVFCQEMDEEHLECEVQKGTNIFNFMVCIWSIFLFLNISYIVNSYVLSSAAKSVNGARAPVLPPLVLALSQSFCHLAILLYVWSTVHTHFLSAYIAVYTIFLSVFPYVFI